LEKCKKNLLITLADANGETACPKVLAAVQELMEVYKSTGLDIRKEPTDGQEHALDGIWLTVSRPNYSECLGQSTAGEYMYTLGRMSFDRFRPTGLVCSIQGLFNPVFVTDDTPETVPRSLGREVQQRSSTLRTYK